MPLLVIHFSPSRTEPHDIFDIRPPNPPSHEIFRTMEYRMLFSKLDKRFCKLEQTLALGIPTPMKPVQFVVLAISIVVPILRAAEFVPGVNHRDALRK